MRTWLIRVGSVYALFVVVAVAVNGIGACSRPPPEPVQLPSQASQQTSASCRECHADAHAAWHGTDHALANREVARDADEPAFGVVPPANAEFVVEWTEEGPGIDMQVSGLSGRLRPAHVLGNLPLRQFLIPQEGGRWQPLEWAYDPEAKEWFNVFGSEGRRPGEWGHWTGRGMNWNSMCAHCHMTGFRKNYDAATDSYHSTWVEQGVSCIQCHGPMPDGHGTEKQHSAIAAGARDPAWIRDPHLAEQTCAYCHARNEPLTSEFPPGANYYDHFRVTLPVETGVFHPDGQQLAEDFNWTSILLSRMHHAGVTCMDCHEPHSSATRLPVENNALCMQCHAAPGRVMPTTLVQAPQIDPTAHSHHADGSTGNQCVSCHMPTTTYMARAPRHDHGWLKPDPLLTQELGIPNACNRCHEDKPVAWAVAAAEAWYGEKLQSRQRERARAVAAAQKLESASVEPLLKLVTDEDIPAWKATYLHLLAPWAQRADVNAVARQALADPSPLVRSAAVQAVGSRPDARAALRDLLDDPVRLVRLDAAWLLADELDPQAAVTQELQAYLELGTDQPAGQLRLGQYYANVGRLPEADRAMRKAAEWDPYSAPIYENHALVLHAMNRPADAAALLRRSAELQPTLGEPLLRAALLFAEAGRPQDARVCLEQAVERQPELDRAWYNLGLLHAQANRHNDALAALARAEAIAPRAPEYPYARATILWQLGRRDEARDAARRALEADPMFAPARRLLGGTAGGGG